MGITCNILLDIIPKITKLSLFLQKGTVDLAMTKPNIDSVIHQLTFLEANDGNHLDFMSVAATKKLIAFPYHILKE
jgi:hypothetical protein